MNNKGLKIFIAMSRALVKVNRQSSQVFRKFDLTTGQFAVLEALYHKGDRTVGELQELILSTTGNMPVIINNLKDRGLVESCKKIDDKRFTVISLTERGRELISKVFPENKIIIEEYFSKLSGEEQKSLLKMLLKFKEDKDE